MKIYKLKSLSVQIGGKIYKKDDKKSSLYNEKQKTLVFDLEKIPEKLHVDFHTAYKQGYLELTDQGKKYYEDVEKKSKIEETTDKVEETKKESSKNDDKKPEAKKDK